MGLSALCEFHHATLVAATPFGPAGSKCGVADALRRGVHVRYAARSLFAPYLGMNRQFFYDSWDQPLIIDNGKSVREYGFEYIPLNVSVRHMVEEMKKLKLITAP